MQDLIGWRMFMEGMLPKGMFTIQSDYVKLWEYRLALKQWAQGLVVKLLEVVYGRTITFWCMIWWQEWRQWQGNRRFNNKLRVRLSWGRKVWTKSTTI
jgi:hypothetical protein